MKIAFAIIGEAQAAGTEPVAAVAGSETHATTEAGHGAVEGQGGAFPPFDPTFFASQLLWLAICFGVFYLLMARLAIPRIADVVETRKNRISQDLDEASRLKGEADAAQAAYEHELSQARSRATGIGGKARDEAKAKVEAERHRIEADLAGKLSEAEARIASIKTKALKEVGAIAAETTGVIVRELLGSEASPVEIANAIAAKR